VGLLVLCDDPYEFEACAAKLWQMQVSNASNLELTRRFRDGGRDAIGTYRIGPHGDRIGLEFALEAKCYNQSHGVTVKDVSRLRHRQFGVLITTSYLGEQAYQEIRADGHPVVVIAAADIVEILRQHCLTSIGSLQQWLATEFPKNPSN
jgi:hypothetical protein